MAALIGLLTAASSVALAPPSGAVAGFGDVAHDQYFTPAVQWLVDEGITTGTSATCFEPSQLVTRGQAAVFLWRMAGRPEPTRGHPFVDVTASWQQSAVAWMASEGITTGTTATTYSPDAVLSRGQIAALLWRLAGRPSTGTGSGFADVTESWQIDAVAWMAAEGITTGVSAGRFAPDDQLTRGQLATFLYRSQGSPAVSLDPSHPTEPRCAAQVAGPPNAWQPAPHDDPDEMDETEPSREIVNGGVTDSLVKTPDESGIFGEAENTGELDLSTVDLNGSGTATGYVAVSDSEGVGGEPPTIDRGTPGANLMPGFDLNAAADDALVRFEQQQTLSVDTQGWLDYDHLPYGIGQLTIQFPGGSLGSCTGTLVARDLVLTAAHCLYRNGQAFTGMWFQPDEYGNTWDQKRWWYIPPSGGLAFPATHTYQRCASVRGAIGCGDLQVVDYALMRTDPRGGRLPGDVYNPLPMHYLGLASGAGANNDLYEWDVARYTIGYPIEGWWSQWSNPSRAWPWLASSDDGFMYNWNGTGLYLFAFGGTTNGGHSGAPVFQLIDGKRYVVGVVSSLGQFTYTNDGGRWWGQNVWAVPLLATSGNSWGFDDLWRSVR